MNSTVEEHGPGEKYSLAECVVPCYLLCDVRDEGGGNRERSTDMGAPSE